MKKLFYAFIVFSLVTNVFAGRVMLAEGEIIVLDTTATDVMPAATNTTSSQTDQTSIPQSNQTDPGQDQQIGYLKGSVSRSVFTSDVNQHEPIDKIEKLKSNNRSVVYFTELRDMSGQTATHRWEFNGNVMAETKFAIAGPRWRVWSSKNLLPTWTGEWKVSVLNGVGEVISEDVFSYVEGVAATETIQETLPATQETTGQQEEGYINDNLN